RIPERLVPDAILNHDSSYFLNYRNHFLWRATLWKIKVVADCVNILPATFFQKIIQPVLAFGSFRARAHDGYRGVDFLEYLGGLADHLDHGIHVAKPRMWTVRLVPKFINMNSALVPRRHRPYIVLPIMVGSKASGRATNPICLGVRLAGCTRGTIGQN